MSADTKRKAPAFQFYADDFLAGTADMSAEEVGGYIRLLCHQWTKGGIPNDEERAGRMAGLMGSPSIRYVLAKFSPCDDGMLRNARLEQVRQDQADYKAKQATSGKVGAQKRWSKYQNDGDPNRVAIATPMATPMAKQWPEHSSPSPTPTPEIQSEIQSPLTPQWGMGLESLKQATVKQSLTDAPSIELESFKLRIGSWFKRRPNTTWSEKEMKALKAVSAYKTPEDELNALEAYYNSSSSYLRRDIITLLNNWNTEIDRAKQPPTQNTLNHGPQSDPIARRNALLGDDVAQQQAEAARISRERYLAEQQRFEATGLTPFD